jgi:hypothetical protein
MGKFAATRVAALRQEGKHLNQMNLDYSGKSKDDRESMIQALEDAIETKHLRYCDPSQPLHLASMLVARYGLNVARFLMHHPRNWGSIEQTPLDERQKIWEVCLKLLEQQIMLQTNPVIKCFAWNAPYFRQWHAFIHVLDTLRAEPRAIDADRAWRIIEETYENNPEMIEDMRKPIHAAVGNLCLKAYNDREALLRSKDMNLSPSPNFVALLRSQCDSARARRQKRTRNSRQVDTTSGQVEADTRQPREDVVADHFDDLARSTQSLAQTSFRLAQDNVLDSASPFTFEDNLDGPAFDSMVIDGSDNFLAADFFTDDMALEPVDWSKFDEWLGHAT